MLKIAFVAILCLSIFANVLSNTIKSSSSNQASDGYFKVNNVQRAEEGCVLKFECKKKLKNAEAPKPCLKFCVKSMECENGKRTQVPPGQCVELNEAMVIQEYNDCRKDGDSTTPALEIMPVALIDFPCQPGYLPDSRGRCREVW